MNTDTPPKPLTDLRQRRADKTRLIEALTSFIGDNMALKSAMLQVEATRGPKMDGLPKLAHDWAKIKEAVPGCQGYPDNATIKAALERLLA